MKIIKRMLLMLLPLAICAASLLLCFGVSADALRIEAEDLTYVVTDAQGKTGTESSWVINEDLKGASKVSGKLICFSAGGVGATVEYTVNVEEAGTYGVAFAYRPHKDDFSVVQISVNGKNVGGEISMKAGDYFGEKANTNNVSRKGVLGNAEFVKGDNKVTVTMTELNENKKLEKSAFTFDYLELTEPVDESTLVFTERKSVDHETAGTKENQTPVSVTIPEGMTDTYPGTKAQPKTTDKITVWKLPSCYTQSPYFTLVADGVEVPVTTARGQYDYAYFDYDAEKGEIQIKITANSQIRSATVSPQHLDVNYKTTGNTLLATLKINYNYTFKINDRVLNISATPMEKDVPASSGAGVFNITAAPYSVKPSMSDAEMTAAIQQALDDASAYGSTKGNKNGVVYIPAGVYTVGNLSIGSNTYLYLEGDAVLRISTDKSLLRVDGAKDSMKTPEGTKGLDFTRWISTKFRDLGNGKVEGSYDIRIGGRGTVDARDDYFYKNTSMGNNTIDPVACTGFTLEGLVVRESVCWSIIAARSNDLTFDWLKIYNRVEGNFEGDCIDICECQDVNVTNCIGFARDDPFSTKCWDYKIDISETWPGYPEYLDNVTFEDCTAYTGCVAFKVGQGIEQSQYNITFKDCTVLRATIGISVHHKFGTGVVDTVTFENIYIENIFGSYDGHSAWLMLFCHNHSSRGNGPIKNVYLKNIYIYRGGIGGNDGKKLEITGLDLRAKVDNVLFNNIYFDGKLAEELDDIKPTILTNQYTFNVRMKNGELTEADLFPEDDKKKPQKDDDPVKPQDPEDDDTKNEPAFDLTTALVIAGSVLAVAGAALATLLVLKKKSKKNKEGSDTDQE